MAITEVAYCTREDVQRALNFADIPRLNTRVDQAIMAGARQIHGLLHRRFYPVTKTVAFDQPEGENLWLYELELAGTPTQILSGGTAMTIGTDVFLRPKSGPPYRWLEANTAGTVFWKSTGTPQAAISVTGDYYYPVNPVVTGTLGASTTIGASTITLNDSGAAGVGSLILIDSERLIVSDKTMSTTGATISADLTTSKSQVTVAVSSGVLVNPGELILIDSERMQVEYVVGNTLTVDRAVNGSALATHTTGATIYAPRTATVLRGRHGSTAAGHNSGATITALKAPSLIAELNLAYAINNQQGASGTYARSLETDVATLYKDKGRGVLDLENDAYQAYGRKARGRAV
jgi:hypothetical protein